LQIPDLPTIFFYILFEGLPVTLQLTAHGLLWGFLIGLSLALARVYAATELGWLVSAYEKVLRGIPLLVLIFLFDFGIPGIFSFIPLAQRPLASVVLSLALRSGAFQSEIFRGAILSVSPGQLLAARALGLSKLRAVRYVVLPQALRMAVPGWTNEYAIVIKDSSFASAVGIVDMTEVGLRVTANFPGLWVASMIVVAVLYFIFTYPVTRIFGEGLTKRLRKLGLGGG
jgi:polar amino acid transport system permease protein